MTSAGPKIQDFRVRFLLADSMSAAALNWGLRHVPLAALRSDYTGCRRRERGCAMPPWTIKDMGRTMAALKERFSGRMDFSKASAVVKKLLAG
jgi:hypothetical protein